MLRKEEIQQHVSKASNRCLLSDPEIPLLGTDMKSSNSTGQKGYSCKNTRGGVSRDGTVNDADAVSQILSGLPFARLYSKHSTSISSFNSQSRPVQWVLLFSPFYRRADGDTQQVNNLPS